MLLQEVIAQTNVNDISFRLMDVVMIVGGIGTLLISFLTQKARIQGIEDAFQNYKTINDKCIDVLTADLTKQENKHSDFTKDIFTRLDKQNDSIHELSKQIGILTQIIKNEEE